MAKNNSRTRRIDNSAVPHFRLDIFESKLRSALGTSSNRGPGVPGAGDRALASNPRTAAVEYLIDSLMSKYDDGVSSEGKADAAYLKFFQGEEICYWNNFFFAQDSLWIDKNHPELAKAREIIHDLLGPYTDLQRIARGFGWGPGASTRLSRLMGDASYKYSGSPEVTPNAYAIGVAAIADNPNWKQLVDLVDGPATVWGSRLTTVPKNYKIDRVIAVEPCLNMYVQKGIGSYIRQKLASVGINLNSQDANRAGAGDLSLATIDFSMASDTMSQGLVRYMIPESLCNLITQTRSEFTVLPSKMLHRLSKVSSMGNGFTFELETLIFWALACACVPVGERSRVLVYGDDVLIPREYAERFIQVAKVAGFTTNRDKTFLDGPFRESCGIHFHSGHDVTPFYIRRKVDKLSELFLLHNNLRRWLTRVDVLLNKQQYDGVQLILRSLRDLAPAKWRRPRIPDGFGDGAFIGSFAECSPGVHKGGWEYFVVTALVEKAEVVETEVPGLLVKSMTNLHKRRRIIQHIWEPTFAARPSSGRGLRARKIAIPWDSFG